MANRLQPFVEVVADVVGTIGRPVAEIELAPEGRDALADHILLPVRSDEGALGSPGLGVSVGDCTAPKPRLRLVERALAIGAASGGRLLHDWTSLPSISP